MKTVYLLKTLILSYVCYGKHKGIFEHVETIFLLLFLPFLQIKNLIRGRNSIESAGKINEPICLKDRL